MVMGKIVGAKRHEVTPTSQLQSRTLAESTSSSYPYPLSLSSDCVLMPDAELLQQLSAKRAALFAEKLAAVHHPASRRPSTQATSNPAGSEFRLGSAHS
jgi:hypothetical protein